MEISRQTHEQTPDQTPDNDHYEIPNYLVSDLTRIVTKVAANEGWYRQSWLGAPIWQLPDDLMLLQRIVAGIRPALIVETGTKYGGSALFFASLLELLDLPQSRIITVDICETEAARQLLSSHRLGRYVQERLVASSLDPAVLATIAAAAAAAAEGPVLVFLDDWHGGDHVLAELHAYGPHVGPDGLLVVSDTTFADLAGTPVAPFRSLQHSNPRSAIDAFLLANADFERTERFLLPGLSNFADGQLQRCRRGLA
jgi:cephalosporin hydroxylase